MVARRVVAVVVLGLAPASVFAQQDASAPVESTAAQALFEEGRRLLQEGHATDACPKFAASQRLEPATGTLLNLALCHEQEGKSASAWLEYNDVLALAAHEGDAERKAIARARVDSIGELLSRLSLKLPPHPPNDLWIELDGVRLSAEAWSTGVPVDPGTHVVRVGAAGKQSTAFSVEVVAATNARLGLPELRDAKLSPSVRAPQLGLDAEPRHGIAMQPLLLGAALGLAVSGVGLATYSGLRAGSEWKERNEHCRSGCDEQAVAAGRNAKSAALISTISTGAAAASLGVAVFLFFYEPHQEKSRARLSVSGGLSVGGASLSAHGWF